MVWTEEKDVKLLRAVAAEGVFINRKAGSREKGALRQAVASSLVAEGMPVISRLVRDRFNILAKEWRVKVRQEERESGAGDEETSEAEKLVEELVELEILVSIWEDKRAEVRGQENGRRGEKEGNRDEGERAMERFSQTKKRQEETEKDEGKKKKKRRRPGEAIEWHSNSTANNNNNLPCCSIKWCNFWRIKHMHFSFLKNNFGAAGHFKNKIENYNFDH